MYTSADCLCWLCSYYRHKRTYCRKNPEYLLVASKKFVPEVNNDKISTCSYLKIKIQDEVNMCLLIIAPLKGWTSSNMWKQPKQIKILFRKKSERGGNQWMIFSLCKFKIKIYWFLILLVLLYGCETWSLTMREERSLRVCKNSMLIIFETMMDEVIREWIKLLNEDHNDMNFPTQYDWGNQISKN
jgi:hypothetical protein